LQRYTLKLALGLAAAADDDGKKTSAPQTITPEQEEAIRTRITGNPAHDITAFLAHFQIETLSELPASKFKGAMFAMSEREKNLAKESSND
jgi:hypothetical protein